VLDEAKLLVGLIPLYIVENVLIEALKTFQCLLAWYGTDETSDLLNFLNEDMH
jgi:hypothetical protein